MQTEKIRETKASNLAFQVNLERSMPSIKEEREDRKLEQLRKCSITKTGERKRGRMVVIRTSVVDKSLCIFEVYFVLIAKCIFARKKHMP